MESDEEIPLYEKAEIEKKLESVIIFYEEIVRKMKYAYDDLNQAMLYVKSQMEIMLKEKNKSIFNQKSLFDQKVNESLIKETKNQKETIGNFNILHNALEKQIEADEQYLDESKVIKPYEEKENVSMKSRNFLNNLINNLYKNVYDEKEETVFTKVINEKKNPLTLESNHLGSTRIEEEIFDIKNGSNKKEGTYQESSDCTLTISDDENHIGNLHWKKKRPNNHVSILQNKKKEKDRNQNQKQDSYVEQFDSLHYWNDSHALLKNAPYEKTHQTYKEEILQTEEKTKYKEDIFVSKTNKGNHTNDLKHEIENHKINGAIKENQGLSKENKLFPLDKECIPCAKKTDEPTNPSNEYKDSELKGKTQINYDNKNQLSRNNTEQNETKENNVLVSDSILNLTTNDSNKVMMNELLNNKMYMEMMKENIRNTSMNHFSPMHPMSPLSEIYLNNYLIQKEMINSTLQTISQMNMINPNYLKATNVNHFHMLGILNALLQKDDIYNEERNDKTTHGDRKLKRVQTNCSEKESKGNESSPPMHERADPINHLEEFTKKIKKHFSNQIKEEVNNYLDHVLNIRKKKRRRKSNICKKGIQSKEIKYKKPKKMYTNNRVSSSFISYVESFTSKEQGGNKDLKKQYMKNQINNIKQTPMNKLYKSINYKTLKKNELESNYFKQSMNPQKTPYYNKKYTEIPNEEIDRHREIKKRKRSYDKNREKKKERKIKEIKHKDSTKYSQESEMDTVGSHMENTEILTEPYSHEKSSNMKPKEQIIKIISTEESEYRYISNNCKEDLFITTSDASYSQKNNYDLKHLITRSCTQRNVVNTVKKKNKRKDNKTGKKNENKPKEKKLLTKEKYTEHTENKEQTDGNEKIEIQENSNEWNSIIHEGFEDSELYKGSSNHVSDNSAFTSINNSNTTKDYFISLNEKDNHYFFEDIYPTKYELRSRKQVTYTIPSRKKKLRRDESKRLFDPFAYNNSWKIQI